MSSAKHYTAIDIERYHRGEMTAAEMHLLEKAALDDPMLADALEGYAAVPSGKNDLPQLREKLQQRIGSQQKKKTIFIDQRWLKVAAMFVLLAGAGWFIFCTSSTREADMAAVSQEKTAVQARQQEGFDTASLNQQLFPPASSADSTTDIALLSQRRKQPVTKIVAPKPVAKDAAKAGEAQETTAVGNIETAMAQTGVEASRDNTSSPIDRMANDTNAQQDVALLKRAAPSQAPATLKPEVQARARKSIQAITIEPVNGWRNFETYVSKNKKTRDELQLDEGVKGEVELLFDVNSNGRPVNITVTKPLCERCDGEAIRLLREGPDWKSGTGKGRIILTF